MASASAFWDEALPEGLSLLVAPSVAREHYAATFGFAGDCCPENGRRFTPRGTRAALRALRNTSASVQVVGVALSPLDLMRHIAMLERAR